MDNNETNNEFLANIKGVLVELFPIFTPKEDQREPLTHSQLYAALLESPHFKNMWKAEKTIFKNSIQTQLDSEKGVILPDTQTKAVFDALAVIHKKYFGLTPSGQTAAKKITDQLPVLIENLSEQQIESGAKEFLSASVTTEGYAKARAFYTRILENQELLECSRNGRLTMNI